jgi:hypothetical protein
VQRFRHKYIKHGEWYFLVNRKKNLPIKCFCVIGDEE